MSKITFLIFILSFFSCKNKVKEIDLNNIDKLLIVLSDGWNSSQAKVYLFDKSGANWNQKGKVDSAIIGKSGFAWGLGLHDNLNLELLSKFDSKSEGDLRSPAGVFKITDFMGYKKAMVNFPLNYSQITDSHKGVDDPNSKYYNTIIDTTVISFTDYKSFEIMKRDDDLYKWLFRINHNPENVPNSGSLIFFHLSNSNIEGTSGCTAVSENDFLEIIRWVNNKTLIIQMPRKVYDKYQKITNNLPLINE